MNYYWEAKAARHRALIASIQGGPEEPELSGSIDFDAGVRTDGMPSGERRPPPSWPSDEVGWGAEYELENGAELLMPWLRGK